MGTIWFGLATKRTEVELSTMGILKMVPSLIVGKMKDEKEA